jgi:hypothetical protein
MAQIPLKEKVPSRLEIEEVDESKNVVATYISSAPNDDGKTSRIDVVVKFIPILLYLNRNTNLDRLGPQEYQLICEEYSECLPPCGVST